MVTTDLMISLDGCIAGPNIRPDNPGGDGAQRLHDWIAGLASWRERQGMEGGEENADSALVRAWFDATGAVIMGRTMFDTGVDFWGDDPPFRTPVFVLTHHPRPTERKQGGTSYTFTDRPIADVLAQAKEAASGRNVDIAGGATTVRQFLRARLIDELHLHVLPFLMGSGLRLFGDIEADLEPVHAIQGAGVTHLRYRVLR